MPRQGRYRRRRSRTADGVAGFAECRCARRTRREETSRSCAERYRRAGQRKGESRGAGTPARRGSRPSHRCDCASVTSWPSAAVPGHNPGGGKTCISRYNPRDASAATANSQRGPNRNGRTMNPASAYSVRISPFQIRQRWMSPNASNTTSRRTSSDVRRSLFASRSNWMARPAPNSSENSANAFKSTASIRMVSTALSIDEKDKGGLGKKTARRSKREIWSRRSSRRRRARPCPAARRWRRSALWGLSAGEVWRHRPLQRHSSRAAE